MTPDQIFTFTLSAALLTSGALALWLLPWSDAEVASTTRAFRVLARGTRGQVARWADVAALRALRGA